MFPFCLILTFSCLTGDDVIWCWWQQAGEETITDWSVGANTIFRIIKVRIPWFQLFIRNMEPYKYTIQN